MHILLLALAFAFVSARARADDATPPPVPANLVCARVVGRDREAALIPWGNHRRIAPLIFEFAGRRVKTCGEFKAAVLTLPPGTELRWSGDCFWYTDLPLSGPVTSVTAMQAFCAAHGVNFHYLPGGY